jgi:ribonuclease P protein component
VPSASFPATHRIRKPADFDRIYRARVFVADDVLIVNGDSNGLDHPRLGLSVSTRVGNAVIRNRWKRLIREVFRNSIGNLPAGLDLIARPQKGATPDFASISKSLPALARRLAKRLSQSPNSQT